MITRDFRVQKRYFIAWKRDWRKWRMITRDFIVRKREFMAGKRIIRGFAQ